MSEICPECGAKLKLIAKYCQYCGINVENLLKEKNKDIDKEKIQIEDEIESKLDEDIDPQKIKKEEDIRSKLESEYQEKIKKLEEEYINKIKKEKLEMKKKYPLFNERQYMILIGIIIITIIVLIGFFLGKMYRII